MHAARARLKSVAPTEAAVFGVIGVCVLFAGWEALVRLDLANSLFVSSPSLIVEAAQTELETGTLFEDLRVTVLEWTAGFGAAALVAVPLGLLGGWYRRAAPLVQDWFGLALVTPMVALVPLFILWFGIGMELKVLLAFLIALPAIGLNTLAGTQALDQELVSVARAFGARRLRLLKSVILPGTLPNIVTGIRLGSAQALVGVVFAELVASSEGLGHMIGVAGTTFDTDRLMLGILTLALLAMLAGRIFQILENRLERWRPRI